MEIERIAKIEVARTIMDPGGDRRHPTIPQGKVFTPPDIPKWILKELEKSPKLFNVTYRTEQVDVDLVFDEDADDAVGAGATGTMTAEEEEAFVKEWSHKRSKAHMDDMSFGDYVSMSMGRFREASAEVRAKAIAKWQKLYAGEECPIK